MKKLLVVILAAAFALTAPITRARAAEFNPDAADERATSAECMATLEVGSNRLLYAKNAFRRRPMASTAKILTAIAAIENYPDLNKKVKIPRKAVGVEGSSLYLKEGEEISVKDLLYGLMLRSGNDCAVALAITVSGDVDKFAALMNETARKAGANSSNFVNPHGLHDDEHYTTAYDLALIASYALKNETFSEIASAKSYTVTRDGEQRTILNKNKLLSTFEGASGVKTGFTKKAGRCLVASARRNGMSVVTAVLNCGPMFEECSRLMEEAFDEFEYKKVIACGEPLCHAAVKRGKKPCVGLCADKDYYYPLREGESVSVTTRSEELTAPLKKGAEGGNFLVYADNRLLFEGKLYTIEDAVEPSYWDYLKKFFQRRS